MRSLRSLGRRTRASRVVMIVATMSLVVASACGEGEPGKPRTGAQPTGTSAATPTDDPDEHGWTPTITPLAKDHGPTPSISTPTAQEPYISNAGVTFGPEPTAHEIARSAELFIKGHVVELLPAQWTTPDGQRPDDPHREDPETTYIITPVVIELDGPPIISRVSENAPDRRIVVAAYGGQIGQDRVAVNDPSQVFEVGENVLLGLSSNLYLHGNVQRRYQTSLGPAWNVAVKYTITEDGLAVLANPRAVPRPVADVIADLVAAAAAP